jgi:hypothetical protein
MYALNVKIKSKCKKKELESNCFVFLETKSYICYTSREFLYKYDLNYGTANHAASNGLEFG